MIAKHLQRASEVIALYRRCMELARLFPDPCGRNYLHHHVAEKFRKRTQRDEPDEDRTAHQAGEERGASAASVAALA